MKASKKESIRPLHIFLGIAISLAILYVALVLFPSFVKEFIEEVKEETSYEESFEEVSGFYVMYISEHKIVSGATAENQYAGYYFNKDGTYRFYLSLDKTKWYFQFSGTWSQTGNTITIKIPSIPGTNNPPYSVQGKVSSDGNKIFLSSGTLEKISEKEPI